MTSLLTRHLSKHQSHNARSIVYVGQTPGQGTGSPINMLRHLRAFASHGWKVSVIAEWGQSADECDREGWAVYRLPLRKKWWPPYWAGNQVFRMVRMRLWANECQRLLGHPVDAILTYLSFHSETLSEVASEYARISRIPMSVIVYDDVRKFRKRIPNSDYVVGRQRLILGRASKTWFVSAELADAYGFEPANSVLLPMPAGLSIEGSWREEFRTRPLLCYAGYIYSEQFGLLEKVSRAVMEAGGVFEIISNRSDELESFCARSSIRLRPLFADNADVLKYVAENASAFVAAYCEKLDQMPWIESSFPSKVVEFAHVAIPMLYVSPSGSAIYRWNQEKGVPYNLRPDMLGQVSAFTTKLRSPVDWTQLSSVTRSLAETDYNPVRIHSVLEAEMLGSAA